MTHSVSLRFFATILFLKLYFVVCYLQYQLFLCVLRICCLCVCPQYYTKQAGFLLRCFAVKGLFFLFSRDFFNLFFCYFFSPNLSKSSCFRSYFFSRLRLPFFVRKTWDFGRFFFVKNFSPPHRGSFVPDIYAVLVLVKATNKEVWLEEPLQFCR